MKDWVFPYIKQHKGLMLVTIVLGVIGVTSGAMLLFISGYLISKSSLRPDNIMLVYVPIVATRAFSIGQAVFLYLERLVGHDVVLRIVEKMRTKLYRVTEPQALFIRSHLQTGDLLGVLSEDIEHLQNLYLRTIFPSVIAVFIYAALAITLSFFDWIFAIMMILVLGVIIFLVPFVSLLIIQRKHIVLKQGRNSLYQKLTDAVLGLSDWQASGRTGEFLEQYSVKENELMQNEKFIKRYHYMRDLFVQLIVGIAIVMMIFWTAGQAEIGQIAPTLIAAFVLMILSVSAALIPVSDAVERIPSYKDSVERIASVENAMFSEVREGTSFEDKNRGVGKSVTFLYKELRASENLSSVTVEEKKNARSNEDVSIIFDDVTYQYPGSNKLVLNSLSLTIPMGKKVAILGKSGVGKSTLLKLLTGAIEPTEGRVVIGNEAACTDFLGDKIAVLNQKPHLFDTSVSNNVRIGRDEAEEDEIYAALEQAQIASLIDTLPQGVSTSMHEMGKRFSGGERQRIAFARVLLQNTPIIILDEPTIGLDPKTEFALLQTMFEAAKEKTVIWVTHHLAGIDQMDEIIFIENGRITMQGSHEILYKTNEKYKRLYDMDMGGF